MKSTLVLIVVLVTFASAGVATAVEIIVSAAASLTNAFTNIGKEYEKAHPGQKVSFNFASSGALLQQIARGAPVDVFASADQETMDRADKQNLIVRNSRLDFVRNTLVMVAPKGAALAPKSLDALKDPSIARIAISNTETVPAGRYAKEALEAAGLWHTLKWKSLNTQSVRQSLDYVARGEADAGFVYLTDAAILPDKVAVLIEVPTKTPILYPVAAVKGNGNEKLALRFIEYLGAVPARNILLKYGFKNP